MGILAELGNIEAALAAVVDGSDPDVVSGEDAARVVEAFTRAERLVVAGRTRFARRAAEARVWVRDGERSAAHWLARRSGTTVGQAAAVLETAERLDELPATDAAFRSGRLSETQVREIASAAAANRTPRRHCWRWRSPTRCRGCAGRAGRWPPPGRGRTRWPATGPCTGADISSTGSTPTARPGWPCATTVEDMAQVLAAIDGYQDGIFTAARQAGRREPYHAYRADALVAAARAAQGDGRGAGRAATKVTVVVDHAALTRGHSQPGERCQIAGVGPVPVAVAKAMMADAFLAAVVSDGVDVSTVAHLGRQPTAHQRTALEVRDHECVIDGCHVSDGLEIDHVDGWAITGITKLDRLARLCKWHHHQKTYEGWQLTGTPGHWQWNPPAPPIAGDASASPHDCI